MYAIYKKKYAFVCQHTETSKHSKPSPYNCIVSSLIVFVWSEVTWSEYDKSTRMQFKFDVIHFWQFIFSGLFYIYFYASLANLSLYWFFLREIINRVFLKSNRRNIAEWSTSLHLSFCSRILIKVSYFLFVSLTMYDTVIHSSFVNDSVVFFYIQTIKENARLAVVSYNSHKLRLLFLLVWKRIGWLCKHIRSSSWWRFYRVQRHTTVQLLFLGNQSYS